MVTAKAVLCITMHLFVLIYTVLVTDAVWHVAGCVEGPLPSARCAMCSICTALGDAVRAACVSSRPLLPMLCLILLECCIRLSHLLDKESRGFRQHGSLTCAYGTAAAMGSAPDLWANPALSHLAVEGRRVAVVAQARWTEGPLSAVLLC